MSCTSSFIYTIGGDLGPIKAIAGILKDLGSGAWALSSSFLLPIKSDSNSFGWKSEDLVDT